MERATHNPPLAISATYGDVDRSADPLEAALWMDRVATYPGFAEAKVRALELLAPALAVGAVLDVGCGVGDDLRALGPSALGVDRSRTMLAVAASRGGRFVRGDGAALPLRDSCFSGARADRVLQHVADPERVAGELVRVVVAGGTVVVIDPDQATLEIVGPDPALSAEVTRCRAASVRNGMLAGRMVEVLGACGCDDIAAERFTIELADPGDSFGITTWSGSLVEAGIFDAVQAARFDTTLAESAAAGTFRYRIDLVLTRGVRATGPR